MEINTFLDKLQSYHSEQVFNPWRDFDTSCDIEVKRLKNKWLEVTFIEGGKTRISKIKDGASLQCKF